jgi:hypothetical protein
MSTHLQQTDLAETDHDPRDPIAQAIMAVPIGGEPVQILVGYHRHLMHHWQMESGGGVHLLHVAWEYREDLPRLREPWRWRVYAMLRGARAALWQHIWTREN